MLDTPQVVHGPDKACPSCKRVFPPYAVFCPVEGEKLVDIRSTSSAPAAQSIAPSANPIAPPGVVAGEGQRDVNYERHDTALMEDVQFAGESLETSKSYVQEPGGRQAPAQGVTQGATSQTLDVSNEQAMTTVPVSRPYSNDDDDDGDVLASSGGYISNLIGKTIDKKYLVQSMLGEGGMAVVFKAHHVKMERTVVLKVMQGWLLSNQKSIERFERESKVTAKLNHPNIVTVFDVGTINGKAPYLVMEYIKGESLADKIHRQGALPLTTTANIVIQICRGLQEAHNLGIIHRDLKPDNVLLQDKSDRPDWVKIVDFGISHLIHGSAKRLTKTGRMVGTPEYIAPEQLKDKPMDIRTDLYALGIMIYEMLTGHVPFEGESAESILMKHLMEDAPPMHKFKPEFKEGTPFDSIVAKLLMKEPDARYQTATELRLDIEQAQSQVLFKRG
jgi:Serine/threonine protein kinase